MEKHVALNGVFLILNKYRNVWDTLSLVIFV